MPTAEDLEELGAVTLEVTEKYEAMRRAEALLDMRRAEWRAAANRRNSLSIRLHRDGAK